MVPLLIPCGLRMKDARSGLYPQTHLITAINQLQQRAPAPHRSPRHPAGDVFLHRRLETALERNRQLRDQVADLARKLETAHGEIRRLRTLAQPSANTVSAPAESLMALLDFPRPMCSAPGAVAADVRSRVRT